LIQERARELAAGAAGCLSAQRRVSKDYQGRILQVFSMFLLVVIPLLVGAMPQTSRVEVGAEAIDFTMHSIDGSTFSLRDLRGEQAVILVFFRGAW